MAKWEVAYKVFEDERRTRGGSTRLTMVVEAPNLNVAETMVKNMNGGQRCYTLGTRKV